MFLGFFFPRHSHLNQIIVLEADSQVQRGQERRVEDVGVGSKVQQSPAALRLVLLHSVVEGNVALIITAVQPWEDRPDRRASEHPKWWGKSIRRTVLEGANRRVAPKLGFQVKASWISVNDPSLPSGSKTAVMKWIRVMQPPAAAWWRGVAPFSSLSVRTSGFFFTRFSRWDRSPFSVSLIANEWKSRDQRILSS